MASLPRRVAQVIDAGRALGVEVAVRSFPDGTRTALDAARAIGCEVDQIVKSLVFMVAAPAGGTRGPGGDGARSAGAGGAAAGVASDPAGTAGDPPAEQPVLVLTSGGHRVDPGKVAARLGASSARKADAAEVRAATGYAIGGVAPFGYPVVLRALVDPHLTRFETVWAAAGTHQHVFPIGRDELLRVTGAHHADVTEDDVAPA